MPKKYIITSLLLTLVVVLFMQAPSVRADNGRYQPGLQHLFPYYVPDSDESSGLLPSAEPPSSGNFRPADQVFHFARQQLSFNQQGSLVFGSGLWYVSRLDPNFNENGRCGIAGWECGGQRWNRLENFSQNHDRDPLTLETQLLFINFEMNDFGAGSAPYQAVYNQLRDSSSFEESSAVFLKDYLDQEVVDLSAIAAELYGYNTQNPTPVAPPPNPSPPTAPPGPPPTGGFQPNTIDCRAGTTEIGYIANVTAADSQGRYLEQIEVVRSTDANKTIRTYVHRCLKNSIVSLLNDYNSRLSDPTLHLGGWVWRSHQRQIELRQKHCGTSSYDVWSKPAGECRPPTARPGKSSHQDGLAIDFYCQNNLLSKTSCNGAFAWLDCHAARYGLIVLSSEAWHWYFPLNHPSRLTQKLQAGC